VFRKIAIATICVLLVGAVALLAMLFSTDQEVGAQTRPSAQPKQAPKAAPQAPASSAAAPAGAPGAPSAPIRTETITYDAWTVSCRDTMDGKTKKICSAVLPMVAQQQGQRVNLGAWLIARNNQGALLSVIQTPQVDIGVLITKGVELKLGDAKPRKINYVNCGPQRCEASIPMDEPTIKEMSAAASGSAVITFWKADGADFSINIQSLRGIDKAITAVR
jgi:invasion protein IalB